MECNFVNNSSGEAIRSLEQRSPVIRREPNFCIQVDKRRETTMITPINPITFGKPSGCSHTRPIPQGPTERWTGPDGSTVWTSDGVEREREAEADLRFAAEHGDQAAAATLKRLPKMARLGISLAALMRNS